MLNHLVAAHALINAWDNWTDEDEEASDAILDTAVAYARAIYNHASHQFPAEYYVRFAAAISVLSDTVLDGMVCVPDLTISQVIDSLRPLVVEGAL